MIYIIIFSFRKPKKNAIKSLEEEEEDEEIDHKFDKKNNRSSSATL